jgi:predicted DNA-binding transcriptional regulator AlpA
MRLLRMKALVQKTGLSEAELERRRRHDPHFPQPVRPGPSIVAWIESEIDAYLDRYRIERDRAQYQKHQQAERERA